MIRHAVFAACVAAVSPLGTAWSQAATSLTLPSLEAASYTLANGLKVVLHEDHKSPIVNVYVAYEVGSAAESPGTTGLAHLFEHLMFRGSEHSPIDYEAALDRLGATGVSGVTHQDYTRYFETVPSPSLATVLWMEADRMCCLLSQVTQARLDEQRRVVRNEILEGQNQPYGRAAELMLKASYSPDHPYSRPVVGDLSDLDHVTLEELQAFFREYYAPNNAVLVVTGDFVADTARRMIDQYFGGIPSGGAHTRVTDWVAAASSTRRTRVIDRVPQARLSTVWNVPGLGTPDFDYLQLVANVIASPGSPLARRLVRDQLATDVNAWIDARSMSSSFTIQIAARDDAAFPRIRQAVDDELRNLERTGPTDDALSLAKSDIIAGFVRRLERLGGFGGQSDEIGTNVVFFGDPAAHLTRARRVENANVDTIRAVTARWLREPTSETEWVPSRDQRVAAAPRPPRPDDAASKPASLASIERATLKNGLAVMLVRRPGNRIVSLQLLVPAGSATDPTGRDGLASLASAAMTQGTTSRSSDEFASDLRAAATSIQARVDADYCTIIGSVPLQRLGEGIHLFARAVVAPAFEQGTLDRLKRDQARRALQASASPATAWRPLIAAAFGGGGGEDRRGETPQSIGSIQRTDVVDFHAQRFRPNGATLVVAGDVSMPDLVTVLEREFNDWQPGPSDPIARPSVTKLSEPIIYLIDRPGAVQTDITVAVPLPSHDIERDANVDLFASVFGSGAESRLSADLRTSKGWAYSPSAGIVETRSSRLLVVRAPVQSAATVDAVREIRQLVHELASDRPATSAELDRAKAELTKALPGRWEATDAVSNAIAQLVRADMPAGDYWNSFPSRVATVAADGVTTVARGIDTSPAWVWVLVGDRSRLESELRASGVGRVVTP